MDAIKIFYKDWHIQSFIIITSNGDFSPLVQKLQELGIIDSTDVGECVSFLSQHILYCHGREVGGEEVDG